MKKVFNGFLFTAMLALSITACKKDIQPNAANEPNAPSESAAIANGNRVAPGTAPRLTKVDNDSLIYANDGRLAKVQHSASSFTQYTYSFNYITAKTFDGSDLTKKIVYQLDLQTDRVVESEEHKYSYPAPNVTIHDQKWFKFEYDAEGHLKKKYNKYQTYERSNFSWGADGNLVTVYFHDQYNEILQHIWYGRSVETDKLNLQPVRSGLDPYLKIFGKGSKNMMHILQRYPSSGSTPDFTEYHNFQFNAGGYPTSCTIVDAATNKRIDSYSFQYAVAP